MRKRENEPIPQTGVRMPRGSKESVPDTERERRPMPGTGWRELHRHAANLRGAIGYKPLLLSLSVWYRTGVMVGSSLEIAAAPVSKEGIPQWHLSISAKHRRATDIEVRQALVCFGVEGAEEDNQHPGMIVRNFWLPVDPVARRSSP